MAKLSKDDAITVVMLFTRAQNKLKGSALDSGRMAIPVPEDGNDRQLAQFKKTVKDKASLTSKDFITSLIKMGIFPEDVVDPLRDT